MGKKTVKDVNGNLYARDEKGHYAGKVATGGKATPSSGPIVPKIDTDTDDGLTVTDDPTTVAYAIYMENQERLYDDMHSKRLADARRQLEYYSTNPRMADTAAHSAREIAFLEERHPVDYTAVSEGVYVKLTIKSIYTDEPIWFNLYGGKEERHDEMLQKYLAKNGAYWSTVTSEDLARFREGEKKILRDTAQWGSD